VLAILIVMAVIVVVAGLVLAYAAWPHRGARVPVAPWLGTAMDRARAVTPVLEPGLDEDGDGAEQEREHDLGHDPEHELEAAPRLRR
jgi:hypothetical protein